MGCDKSISKSMPRSKNLEWKPSTEDELKRLFLRYDTDKDGHLSKQELTGAFRSLGLTFPAWRALNQADLGGDKIEESEVNVLVKYALKRGRHTY
ncbi:hypothetical protein JRO89_XS07G0067200 [Xanthoceras sorbifolium]|uniref:EF-hand domain-containing protein n=1 Tax=Xanthoceras sorbifolium TaxID=99658 RepID=A0ABQ8HST9_9ROSI|nr:hypothetical protein JRO89_XS07G0067200 [Xanthoceras sorbifolium]